VSWKWSICHIAVTGSEPRTAEFELQDSIVDIIGVEQHGWNRTRIGPFRLSATEWQSSALAAGMVRFEGLEPQPDRYERPALTIELQDLAQQTMPHRPVFGKAHERHNKKD
jgi:hypothetical protein